MLATAKTPPKCLTKMSLETLQPKTHTWSRNIKASLPYWLMNAHTVLGFECVCEREREQLPVAGCDGDVESSVAVEEGWV